MARTDTASVSLNAADITDTVLGQISVRAEEDQSRTAEFTYLPGAGTYAPEDWLGKAVTIDHVSDPDGSPVTSRIFTGFVNWTDLDETTKVLTVRCTDLLQDYFEALTTDAAILAVITGAKLEDDVFGEREDGWQRAQDALSTVRKSVAKSRAGVVTLTDWAAKGTADFAYTSSGYLHESPIVTFSERREITNSIVLSYQYRYTRNKIREHAFGWAAGPDGGTTPWPTWCDWYENGHDLQTTENIENAGRGTGWPVVGAFVYTHHPVKGTYSCSGGPVVWFGIRVEGPADDDAAQEEARKKIAYTAAWTGRKRFAQTITEAYAITVACAGSVAKYGSIIGEDGAVYSPESDDSGFESSADTEIPAGYSQDAIGDYISDQGDRDKSDDIVECLMQLADNKIAGSHRRNYVEWRTPIEPTIDLDHTAQITAGNVTAKGKAIQIGHDLDMERGEFTTTIKIACSRGGGGSSDSLAAPAPPSTAPTHGAPAGSTQLTNYYGGANDSEDWDDADHEDESYVSGNQSIILTADPAKIYPHRVHVIGPEIEAEARDAVEAGATPSYNVAVPDDVLTVTL